MKRIILTIILILFALTAISGVDEMRQRQPGQEPTYQKDKDDDDDNGHGNGHGGGPKVPIDDYIPILAMGAVVYGVYKIKKEKSIN